MTDITRILSAIQAGDPHASGQLLPLVYDELRKLAAHRLASERPGQTLGATDLVHEAYLRLLGPAGEQHWDSRGHFFAAAATAMRRILVDHARRKRRPKHCCPGTRISLDEALCFRDEPNEQLLALDDALQRLAVEDPAKAQIVDLYFFGGLSLEEAGKVMGLSYRTAKRHWAYARAWLYAALSDVPSDE